MECAWEALLNLLPIWMRECVDKQGRDTLQELRLRIDAHPQMIMSTGRTWLENRVTAADLQFCVNMASKYSPWSAVTTQNGYITAIGGHRIGLCGTVITENGVMKGYHSITSLCIRVSRDFIGISKKVAYQNRSILIIGSPGCGKTTLLRDLIRQISHECIGSIAVVDEKAEIFPMVQNKPCFSVGCNTDVLTGCSKEEGIEVVLRNMGPKVIAVDEITSSRDCDALIKAGWCGVSLIATAHAGSRKDLYSRPVYRPIIENKLFDTLVVMDVNKNWHTERMNI